VRVTEFRRRLREAFGEDYAETFARDHVLTALGDRTVDQALADGVPAKEVWRTVHDAMRLPARWR
jgi:hypothetical protein